MSTERISLEEFILETMQTPCSEITMGTLDDCFQRLCLPETLIEKHIHFSRETYTRNLVCRTPRFDMLILCWKPGHITTIHDHVDSLNCTRVIHGQITNRFFRAQEQRGGTVQVEVTEEDHIGSGRCSGLDRGGIHQMENTSDGDAVTLHIYAAPLRDITVYDPDRGTKEQVQLRYTLEDEFA